MFRYILKRFAQFIPVFIGVTLLLFFITTILPGDPVALRAGEKKLSPAVYAEMRHAFGLDKPWYVQYVNYLGDLTQGDLGTSIASGRKVEVIFKETYPYTLKLALAAITLEILVGIGAGLISAIKQYTFWDTLVTLSTSILVALPVFWLGIMLQYVFGIQLHILPISGASSARFSDFAHLVLPAITLASVSTAYAARIMRSQLLEVQSQDYVRTAYAKGLSPTRVLWGHEMKNALIPVVTFVGLDLGAMLSGAILTETIFNWPGVGFTIYKAIGQRDFPVVFGGVTIVLFAVLFVNLLVDVSYAFLDPRIRFGDASEG
ncbi:MAG: ABC transporter permease [Actinobacteria bacterium HGW-Actinobacteria-6]|nr:MAG: ABC transporter permease [Actinobacteria bacterium HGW-Actinobacteria-6]